MPNAKGTPQPIKVLSIICPSFSGSTLLTLLLATHPEIATLGERQFFYTCITVPFNPKRRCSCNEFYTECSTLNYYNQLLLEGPYRRLVTTMDFTHFQLFRSKRMNQYARRIFRHFVSEGRFHPLLFLLKNRFARVVQANESLIQSVLEKENASVFLDSSKNLDQAMFLSSSPMLDVYIIQLVRDGRGQTYSRIKNNPGKSYQRSCQAWANTMQSIDNRTTVWDPTKIVTIKYEDLCARPSDTLSSIFEFVDLDPRQGSLNFRDFEYHIFGNSMRRGKDDKIIDRQVWRQHLTTDQLDIFNQIAGPINRKWGYE